MQVSAAPKRVKSWCHPWSHIPPRPREVQPCLPLLAHLPRPLPLPLPPVRTPCNARASEVPQTHHGVSRLHAFTHVTLSLSSTSPVPGKPLFGHHSPVEAQLSPCEAFPHTFPLHPPHSPAQAEPIRPSPAWAVWAPLTEPGLRWRPAGPSTSRLLPAPHSCRSPSRPPLPLDCTLLGLCPRHPRLPEASRSWPRTEAQPMSMEGRLVDT